MVKYHTIISLIIALAYLTILQVFTVSYPIFRFLFPVFFLFALAVAFYNKKYLERIAKYNFWVVVRSFLLLLSGFGIFMIIPSSGIRTIFLAVSAGLIFIFQYAVGNFAENLLINETLIIAFGFFFTVMALAHDYFPVYYVYFLALLFVALVLLIRSFYEFVPKSSETKVAASISIALFCVELFWALNFLHFHSSVLALMLFNFFYFCLILNYYYLFQTLSFKKIQFHLGLITFCVFLVILSTPWKILS